MPAPGRDHFARLEAGGRRRDPATLVTHLTRGVDDVELLRGAATVRLEASRHQGTIHVEVEVINACTGHHLPTGSPLRQVLLEVDAMDHAGARLALAEGPTLPEWCGDLAGRPGRAYAKILEDAWTGEFPTAAYWRPCKILSDSRIAAFEGDRSIYRFTMPTSGLVTVTARLTYRRAFAELAALKGWTDPDIVMWSTTVSVP